MMPAFFSMSREAFGSNNRCMLCCGLRPAECAPNGFLINIEEGAEATLFYRMRFSRGRRSRGPDADHGSLNPSRGDPAVVYDPSLGKKRRLRIAREKASIEREGSLEWGFANLGARSSKTIASVDLLEPGAKACWTGFSFLEDGQQANFSTFQNHRAR